MENNCTRCHGLVVLDFDEALGKPNPRCVCCGHRPLDPPPRPPDLHHLSKPKVGNLTTCRCGKEKVEWRSYCKTCSKRKLNKEQKRIYKLREEGKNRHGVPL